MSSRKERISPQLYLRPAEEGDCKLLWQWRNEETTRKWSFNSAPITYGEHRQWFLSKLHSNDTKLLVILNEDKRKIGQVRFDISPDGSAKVNISIANRERNKGYGSTALKLACQYVWEKFNVRKVLAYIKERNQASINAFAKAGFTNLGVRNFMEHRVVEMIFEAR